MARIRNFFLLLRGQMWILPVGISGLALALAYYLLRSGDELLPEGLRQVWWLYSGDASSARTVFASLLSGLMTMTSLVVSVTFVILTLAANQLGPRLISTFISDRQIQAVLGFFLGTILYVILVLRTLGDELGSDAVPHIAVTVGSGLTILCLFTLLFYLHKVARAIIADNVVDTIGGQLLANIAKILPEREASDGGRGSAPPFPEVATLSLDRRGYIQTVNYDALISLAKQHSALIRIDVRAGHFVMKRGMHVRVFPEGALDARAVAKLRKAFVIGHERTPAQDLEHGIRQLVEVALRALSPGINDPYTAIAVLDQLASAFEDILNRSLPDIVLRDDAGDIRVVADRSDLDGLFDAAFNLIRESAREHPAILIHMADVFGQLAPGLPRAAATRAVSNQLTKLRETAQLSTLAPGDRNDVFGRIGSAQTVVERQAARIG